MKRVTLTIVVTDEDEHRDEFLRTLNNLGPDPFDVETHVLKYAEKGVREKYPTPKLVRVVDQWVYR